MSRVRQVRSSQPRIGVGTNDRISTILHRYSHRRKQQRGGFLVRRAPYKTSSSQRHRRKRTRRQRQ